jgi:hypothetical protein
MDANQIKRESCPKSQNRSQSFNFQFAADCHDWFDSNSKLLSSESQVQRSILFACSTWTFSAKQSLVPFEAEDDLLVVKFSSFKV